ncbi:hypothetical protein BH23CHL2_BH23CHL2_20680 [soil metagenome]
MRLIRKRYVRAFGLLAVVAVILGGGTVLAQPSAYKGHIGELQGVAEVQGSWQYYFRGELASFHVHASKDAEGNVEGHYYASLPALGLRIRGPVTCLNVVDNRAWIAGGADQIWSAETDFNWVLSSETWFQVLDNSDFNGPAAANADITTSIGAAAAPAGMDWCNEMPDMRFPFQVMSGNVIVRDGQ